MTDHQLIAAFRAAGQAQVFAFWEGLGAAERAELLAQAREIDLAEIDRLNRTLVAAKGGAAVDLSGLEPAPFERLPRHGGDAAAWARARATGEAALRAGRVAAFTVAGGQGTRLGYDGPKGTFAVTPVKGKSLFQVFAEKILAAGRRYGRPLHWFIMTSHANHEATEAFFREHRHFGLDAGRVHFFRQGRMPAVGFDGRILLESKSSIAMSPDGHGGSLRALERSGALDLMAREGVDVISYFQVDNPLVRCVDAEFIGWHLLGASDMSSKALPKAYPEEKVGLFCRQGGRNVVIEYSDMPLAMQRETNPDGSLRYNGGSIAIHIIDREFARRMGGGAASAAPRLSDGSSGLLKESTVPSGGEGLAPANNSQPITTNPHPLTSPDSPALPFHRADKKIPTIDAAGAPVRPEKANGIKFEMFVFDALPFARNPVIVETNREDDFSPVKNADGLDSPQTCRNDQLRQFARWFRAAGVTLPTDATGLPALALEVAPTFGYDEATFLEAWNQLNPKPAVTAGLCLE